MINKKTKKTKKTEKNKISTVSSLNAKRYVSTSKPAMSSKETPAPPSTISSRIKDANFDSTPLIPDAFKVGLPTDEDGALFGVVLYSGIPELCKQTMVVSKYH